MKQKTKSIPDSDILRQKAELSMIGKPKTDGSQLSEIETLRLIHELEVNQIELALQNEELNIAKERAEATSRKYSDLYDLAPSGYFTLSNRGKILELNLSGSQMLGIDRKFLINSHFVFFITKDSRLIFNNFLHRIFNNKTMQTCEVAIPVHANTPKFVHLSGVISESRDECIVNMVDISERRKAAEALRKSEELNRAIILQTAMDGFWVTDRKGRLLEVNETYCRMSGYSVQELLSMNISDLEVFESMEDIAAHIEKVVAKGEDRFDSRHRRKDGSIFDVEINIQYQQIQGGRFVVFLHDITRRKQTEEALKILNKELEDRVQERTTELLELNETLRQTEEKYRTVAEYTNDWIYWIGENHDIQYMSPSVERITGYTAVEFIANPQLLSQIVYRDDKTLWQSHTALSHLNDLDTKNYGIEFRIVAKSGELHWIGHSCKRIFLEGEYRGLRVSNRDITDKVNAENELLNVTVEVEERERNRFSLELHDDLGPLLSAIKLYFQWLSETNSPEKKEIIIEKGNSSIERAIRTTREIAHGLGSQIVNNVGYVGAIQNFIQSINDTQKIYIDFKFNSDKRLSNLMEITLYRITTELINNTLRYARAKRVEINFNYLVEKNKIVFTYTDNGIGFDLDHLEIANKGMGLMNIQHRIQLMKGIFGIETSIGNGMKVYIEIPLNDGLKANQAGKFRKQKMPVKYYRNRIIQNFDI